MVTVQPTEIRGMLQNLHLCLLQDQVHVTFLDGEECHAAGKVPDVRLSLAAVERSEHTQLVIQAVEQCTVVGMYSCHHHRILSLAGKLN